MNAFKYLKRQLKRFRIDMATQGTFLAGQIPSIDNLRIMKTASTNYEELEVIFKSYIRIKENDVIIDVGCGKGRVFNYLLYQGYKNPMIGYEINQEVGRKTAGHLTKYPNVEIRCENIFDEFPTNGTIFYMYHPFKEEMMTQFMQHILAMADKNPIIIYNNPVHIDILDSAHFTSQVYDVPVPEYNYNFRFAIARVKHVQEDTHRKVA